MPTTNLAMFSQRFFQVERRLHFALDPALLEDAKRRHFAEQLAKVQLLLDDWTAHASRCHSWALRLSQEILTRSGLPAFPLRSNQPGYQPYVMHFRLAVFVYKRLFRLQAPALRAEEMYPGPNWILNGEGCTAALGTKEQIEGLVAQIDKLLDSEQATALDIQDKLTELQREFQLLIPSLDYAIVVRRLRKKCDLVPFF
jgi:hypothetical protein